MIGADPLTWSLNLAFYLGLRTPEELERKLYVPANYAVRVVKRLEHRR